MSEFKLPEGDYTVRILPYEPQQIWVREEPLSFAELMVMLKTGRQGIHTDCMFCDDFE